MIYFCQSVHCVCFCNKTHCIIYPSGPSCYKLEHGRCAQHTEYRHIIFRVVALTLNNETLDWQFFDIIYLAVLRRKFCSYTTSNYCTVGSSLYLWTGYCKTDVPLSAIAARNPNQLVSQHVLLFCSY